jgi:hypothetical protein
VDQPAWASDRGEREHIDQLGIIKTFIRQEGGVVEWLHRGLMKVSQVEQWDNA